MNGGVEPNVSGNLFRIEYTRPFNNLTDCEIDNNLGEGGGGQLARHGRVPVPFRYKYRCVELFRTRLCLLTPNH